MLDNLSNMSIIDEMMSYCYDANVSHNIISHDGISNMSLPQ